jgi:hypothetical protein
MYEKAKNAGTGEATFNRFARALSSVYSACFGTGAGTCRTLAACCLAAIRPS